VEHGVPQLRERFFLVASRDGASFAFPAPTHRAPDGPAAETAERDLVHDDRQPALRAWDALGDVEPEPGERSELSLRGKWADLLPSIPEGENYLYHTDRRIAEGGGGQPLFGWRRRYWCFLLKLAKDRPSWTLQAQPGPATGPFHWNDRRLSRRELCRLQTFPDDVRISGPHASVQRQVGNAVPALLAEVVAREIRQQLLGRAPLAGPPALLLPRRSTLPAARPPAAVAEKYAALAGEHQAHPGTGQGYRARQRPPASRQASLSPAE
jgi:DNA (cytosine-5)-methyltransferase 1